MDQLVAMRVFERVADEGGFAAAARALDLSPPAVSRLVAELEAHLGTRLLQRTTRRVSLTEAGEAYLDKVRQILQDIEEADHIADAHTNELVGRVRVHTLPVLASYVIAPFLLSFRERYPGIVVDIDVGDFAAPPIEDYDVTLIGTDVDFDANIVARKVVESDAILVASPDYVKRKGMPTTPGDLHQHDCLRLRRPGELLRGWRMWPVTEPAQMVEADVAAVLVANHTDTLLRATLDGVGIATISLDIAAAHLTRGDLVRVLDPWVTGRLAMYAALPSRKFIPQRSRVFLDALVEHTRKQMSEALKACAVC